MLQPSPTITHCALPTEWGVFRLSTLLNGCGGPEHCALSMGTFADGEPALVRVHSECLTGDAFGSLRCDCGDQLQAAMKAIAGVGRGAIIYLRQEGRGIGLGNKIRAYALQDRGADTVDANRLLGLPDDLRRYEDAKTLLTALGISAVRLMTNNPAKVAALGALGISVTERVPLHTGETVHNRRYLKAKIERMGHIIDGAGLQRMGPAQPDATLDSSRVLLAHVRGG